VILSRRSAAAVAVALSLVSLSPTATTGTEWTQRSQRIGGLRAEVAALIVSGQEGGEIDFGVIARPLRGSSDELSKVAVSIEARGETIFPDEDSVGRVEIYAYAVTDRQGVASSLLETFAVEAVADAEHLRRDGLQFAGELDIAPGTYSLRVLIREIESGRMGARTASLIVPDFSALSPQLLAPTSRPPVREWYSVTTRSGAWTPDSATSRPVLASGADAELLIPLIGGSALGSPEIEVVLGDVALPAELIARTPAATGVGEELLVRFDATGTAPGWYPVLARVAKSELASPTTLVAVVPIDEPTHWMNLFAEQESPEITADRGKPVERKRRRRVKIDRSVEEERYREVLATLTDSTQEKPERAADRLLREFERSLLQKHGADVLPELERLEIEVATALSEREPRVLAPIIQLHRRAYSDYFGRREFLLSTFSRRALVQLGTLYLKRVGEHPAKEHGADVFTGLGAELQTRDHGRLAVEMFKRALEINPTNEAAQIGLSMTYERGEAYEDAIYTLKQILEQRPDAWESRLRLALCALRIQRRIAGLRNLKRVVAAEKASPWVRAIATQELARWHLRREEYPEAIELLEGAAQSLPFDTQIRVLLAFAHDAQRDPWSAREILSETAGERVTLTEQLGDSPRRYYAERENSGLRQTLARLAAWDIESRPLLAKQLRATSGGRASK